MTGDVEQQESHGPRMVNFILEPLHSEQALLRR